MTEDIIQVPLTVQIIFYEKDMILSQIFVNQKERITTEKAETILNEKEILFDTVLKITRQKLLFKVPFEYIAKFDFEYKI